MSGTSPLPGLDRNRTSGAQLCIRFAICGKPVNIGGQTLGDAILVKKSKVVVEAAVLLHFEDDVIHRRLQRTRYNLHRESLSDRGGQ